MMYIGHLIPIRERVNRVVEMLCQTIVWRLPSRIIYWATIRAGAHAAQGPYGNQVVPELLFMDVLDRWEKK